MTHLPENPYPLGTVECLRFEHARHKKQRDPERLGQALSAYLTQARKKIADAAL